MLSIKLCLTMKCYPLLLIGSVIILSCKNHSKNQEKNTNVISLSQNSNTGNKVEEGYTNSKNHDPYLLIGDFNGDSYIDTLKIVTNNKTRKDALLYKFGITKQEIILPNGNMLGQDFDDFNWIGEMHKIVKGNKVWNNVKNGEIIGQNQVGDSEKIILQTDAVFIHESEGGGGGIIYWLNGEFHWIQQD